MISKRYTIVIADRQTGVVRRLTLSLRPTVVAVCTVLAMPILIGLGARWSATSEIDRLRAGNSDLQLENTSFRATTGELTTQIASLQSTIDELSKRSELDPGTKAAIEKLPALVRSRAQGGTTNDSRTRALVSAALSAPGDTFGVLRDLLSSLEDRLQIVRTDVERRAALASAAPSIWPALGWITSGFGSRKDPFTHAGGDVHLGLDISADRGQEVYATADGKVSSVGRNGEYGNLVVIDHEFGLETRYAHLSGFAVEAGRQVKRGEVIGYVGATGRATGTHLHYEVWFNGRPINPLGLLVTRPEQAN